jgi:hypothetical protein
MQTVLIILMLLAAADLFTSVLLLSVVWIEHRRVIREAAQAGEMIPSAHRQIGCVLAMCLIGVVVLCLCAWLLLLQT